MQNATKNAKIKECRVMRNRKGKDDRGRSILGKSKGFGFVEFIDHLDAITCLHNLNNNPRVFTDKKVYVSLTQVVHSFSQRPIVEFSIENLSALKIKEKRQQVNNRTGQEMDSKSFEDKNVRADELAIQRTKRQIDQQGLKPLPKKFGVKIRHKNTRVTCFEDVLSISFHSEE